MKHGTIFTIICVSLSSFSMTLQATRMFKAFIPVENASQYQITLSNDNGENLTKIEPYSSSNVRLPSSAKVRITARVGNQEIATDATRNALDLSWKIDVDNGQQINVTKTAQQGGRYDPTPKRNLD